ncbi:MAG: FAD-binding oxidoreductase [Deltaproteobacteria bacterium]|nr:FAD-binding oxidoreductase [Deltaproteobacteria bacterium]
MNPDVIIVGAGVIGTACAYFLSLKKLKVLVLEQRYPASGASGAAASMVNIGGTTGTPEPLRPLNLESHRLIQELESDFDQPIEIMRGGSLILALNEEESAKLRSAYQETRRMGVSCEIVDAVQVRNMEPLVTQRIESALYTPGNYHINPFRLCRGYLQSAMRRGTKILCGVTVKSVEINGGTVKRIVTDRGDYFAERVVIASGINTPEIVASACGISIPVVPARGQVIITEAYRPMITRSISLLSHLYIKQTANGNFYLGSYTEYAGRENRVVLETLSSYAQTLVRVVPVLARIRALRFFAGFRPMSEDGLPIIGPLPECPHLIVASGHGRTGIRYSASTGKAVSELILEGKTKIPVDAFAVDRFLKSDSFD